MKEILVSAFTTIWVSFIGINFGFAQKPTILQGEVLDAQNRQPIEFCQVFFLGSAVGTISDEQGRFRLELSSTNNALQDSFTVSVLGYEKAILSLSDFQKLQYPQIFLKPVEYKGSEIEVVSKHCKKMKNTDWGVIAKDGLGLFSAGLGAQIARFFPNTKGNAGYIKQLYYFIGEDGVPDTKFRVHIYRADGLDGAPGTELLPENLIVHAQKGKEWVKIEVAKYGIEVPLEGFFLAMEWLPDNSTKATYGQGNIMGQVLCAVLESKQSENLTWSCDFMSNQWKQHLKNPEQKQSISPMIRCRVALCP